jgi:hypothetical protein
MVHKVMHVPNKTTVSSPVQIHKAKPIFAL